MIFAVNNRMHAEKMCRWRESDSRPHPYQGYALPLSYNGFTVPLYSVLCKMQSVNTSCSFDPFSQPMIRRPASEMPWQSPCTDPDAVVHKTSWPHSRKRRLMAVHRFEPRKPPFWMMVQYRLYNWSWMRNNRADKSKLDPVLFIQLDMVRCCGVCVSEVLILRPKLMIHVCRGVFQWRSIRIPPSLFSPRKISFTHFNWQETGSTSMIANPTTKGRREKNSFVGHLHIKVE